MVRKKDATYVFISIELIICKGSLKILKNIRLRPVHKHDNYTPAVCVCTRAVNAAGTNTDKSWARDFRNKYRRRRGQRKGDYFRYAHAHTQILVSYIAARIYEYVYTYRLCVCVSVFYFFVSLLCIEGFAPLDERMPLSRSVVFMYNIL